MKSESDSSILYYEKKENDRSGVGGVEEMVKRCTIAGVQIDAHKDDLLSCNGKLYLSISAVEDDKLFDIK